MFDKRNLKDVLVVLLAAFFVVGFAYQASAFSAGGSSTPFTYSGKILALDNAGKIITVQAGPNDEQTFKLSGDGAVMKCSMSASFSDLKIGDVVTVNYFDQGDGTYIANEIDFGAADRDRC